MAKIEIEQEGRSWAIKHDGGYLGHVPSREEALGLVRALLEGPRVRPPPRPSPNPPELRLVG